LLRSSESRHEYSGTENEAEKFVQSALDALSAHVAILDEFGNIIGVNASWRHFADINGFQDPRYGIGTNYLAVCERSTRRRSKDAPVVADGIRAVMRGNLEEFQMEYPCHSPKDRRWFVVRISRFQWYDNVRIIVAHQNVSELKQVQIELAESKRRIEAILNNVNNGILTINLQGQIETVNRATARIFHYTVDELAGMHISELIEEPILDQNTYAGEPGYELTGRRKDGSIFPVYVSLNELKLDDSSVYTCIIQDITTRKQMEAEIIERERMQVALAKERELRVLKNRFLSMMGHELNTPLASISLSYDMLKKYSHISTPEENEQALENIQQQVGHLRDMVKDVMTLSRSEAEGLSIDPGEADLITYCADVVEEFQFAYQKTHNVEFICEETAIRAQIDRRMLRRVLTNLLSNAIKYSPQGGNVIFALSILPDQPFAQISVQDSGIGIPEADISRLFEPFHRGANVDSLPGTGLGLAIVKQIVDLHGGSIEVDSTIGKGTTFYIQLPLHH
jgi:PAS domain S-box-containing protein